MLVKATVLLVLQLVAAAPLDSRAPQNNNDAVAAPKPPVAPIASIISAPVPSPSNTSSVAPPPPQPTDTNPAINQTVYFVWPTQDAWWVKDPDYSQPNLFELRFPRLSYGFTVYLTHWNASMLAEPRPIWIGGIHSNNGTTNLQINDTRLDYPSGDPLDDPGHGYMLVAKSDDGVHAFGSQFFELKPKGSNATYPSGWISDF
ncbi:uncharacterized protein LOC62_02G003247 [Vanrija pseudolonga]|uniref:Uncharacterized protein n=1 Tax=Vanrija pseudolonga TaxID=143232 RepID=A0AAF0Y3W8_9TREE|nr:hypothetical protein LOC62_02G003247 [Vanrija pseudolonga]